MNTVGEFRSAMSRAGLDYGGPILADGKLQRIKAGEDKRQDTWYVLHPDAPVAGCFGSWRLGFSENWCARPGQLTQAEWNDVRQRWKEAEREREKTEAERREKVCKTAAWILARAKPADPGHLYLAAKGVGVYGELREYRGALALPLRDVAGALHTMQFISPDGGKRFLSGGRCVGCFFTLSDKADGAVVLAEGYGTAASIFEATGLATVAAMNCGNLAAVALALRGTWPQRELIVAADNDAWTTDKEGKQHNSGLIAATEAAKAVGARLAVPSFADTASKPTDFNDMAGLAGLAEVKRQIEAAALPTETDEEFLTRLAALPPLEYDRARKAAAKRLGISRLSALDAEVDARRPKADKAAQGQAVELPDVEPWPDPVDGAQTLDAVAAVFSRYLALPPGAADSLALWTAHAHCYTAFVHTPRVNFASPDKGCGKSTALDVLASMVPRPLPTESITAAVLFRLVELSKPTLLLDEVDAYLTEAEELRGLLNAGHKRGARAYRCEGESLTVRGFSAFAPAALAGIGALPGTLHDRSVVIRLVRAKPGEVLARFDSRRTAAETELCRKLARWTADNLARLENADPALPETAYNRLADNWRPLFAIAQAAGQDWPARVAGAFAKLTKSEDADAQGIGTLLLADIAAAFAAAGADRLPSAKLAEALASVEGRPWPEFGKARKPISPNQVANLLRKFGVTPRTIKLPDGNTAKGYHLSDFEDAFARFLPDTPLPNRHPVTSSANTNDSASSEPSPPKSGLPFENAETPRKNGHGYGVTVQNGGMADETQLQPVETAQADLL